MKLYIDAGGTHLRAAWDDAETVRADAASIDLVDFIESLIARRGVPEFIGIAFAGQVHGGRIVGAPNIAVSQPEIKSRFESRYPLRLEIDNDLSCAVMAEGASRQASNLVALYAGTGLGCGVVSEGRVLRGSRGFAAELGHIPYREAPFACGCGKSDCIELYASGSGLAKWQRHGGERGVLTLRQLRAGSPAQRRIAEDFDAALVHAAATAVTLFNPEWLVLGGGIVRENPELIETLRERLRAHALAASLEGLQIVETELEEAPLEGAKLLERNLYA